MLCKEYTLVKDLPDCKVAKFLKCRTWDCPYCVDDRVRDLRHLCRNGAPTKFITLTVNPKWGGSPEERALNLVRAWRLLRRLAERHLKMPKIPFIAVFEKTKKGEPHLHILARCKYLPQTWLSNQMKRLMDAPIVDIRQIRSQKLAVWYITKYFSKAPEKWDGAKRYWFSLNWKLNKEKWEPPVIEGESRWYVVEMMLSTFLRGLEDRGWSAVKDGKAWVAVPPTHQKPP